MPPTSAGSGRGGDGSGGSRGGNGRGGGDEGRDDDGPDPEGRIRVGPYVLLDKLGEGGFGVVYLAERRRPFVQRVALKILKPGVDSDAVIARFEQERQALALMDHPNIAKVLDGGLTEPSSRLGAFRPYFVMELVQGVSLTRYCELNKLGLRERLDLFLTVCDAVQHAHMKGLIHRDLKPGNVLVSEVNGPDGRPQPVVKVIDFGIARAVGGSLTDKTIFTQSGQIMGTPEYMPPEQAALEDSGPLDIDTRADVYSLGVMLYEMLTGSLPFEPDELRRGGILEIVRIIREVEPPKPSTRVGDVVRAAKAASTHKLEDAATVQAPASSEPLSGGTARTTLRIRGVEPASLARQLRGDLDWIVMKAIDKARNRRYESPSSLASDIKRYLRSEPVEAGPPSTGYRVGKFVRRHRVMVAAAAACGLAIAVGLAAALYGLGEARKQRDVATARLSASNGALALLRGTLEVIDPRDPKPTMTAREVFDALADRVKAEGANPEAEGIVRSMLGHGFLAWGSIERARENLEIAVKRLKESRVAQPIDRQLTQLALAWTETTAGDEDKANALLDEILDELAKEPNPSPEAREVLAKAHGLRSVLLIKRDPRRALEEAERSAVIARESDGERSEEHALAQQRVALALIANRGDLERALQCAQIAYQTNAQLHGEASEPAAMSLLVIAHCHEALNHPNENLEALTAAAELFERSGLSPTQTIGDVFGTLAKMLRAAGRRDEALRSAQRCLDVYQRLNPRSPGEAEVRLTIGVLELESSRHAAAVAQFEEAEKILRSKGTAGEPVLAQVLTAGARAKIEQQEFKAAATAAREALAIRQRMTGIEPRLIASTQSILGAALAGAGEDQEAEALLLQAARAVDGDPQVLSFYKSEIIARLVEFGKSRGRNDLQAFWEARLAALRSQP